jgi:rhomboid protease GluP
LVVFNLLDICGAQKKDISMLERKTSGSMVCPSCGRLVSVNAPSCIHCGRKNPGLWGWGPGLSRWLANYRSLVSTLTMACIALYVISLALDLSALLHPNGLWSLMSPGMESLDRMGMTGRYAISQGRWWTLLTAVYLHGGILHILFNVMWLRQLGYMVEELFGTARAFAIFTISGVTGFLLSVGMGSMFTLGSSGAVFGMLGALIFYGRKRGGHFGTAIYKQVGTWAIMAFVFGFLFPNIDNWAHFGGFIGGFLSAALLGFKEFKQESPLIRYLAIALALVTVACFILVIVH